MASPHDFGRRAGCRAGGGARAPALSAAGGAARSSGACSIPRLAAPVGELPARERVRDVADKARIEAFLAALAREATAETDVYLVGGTSAVLIGWRQTTIDIDLVMRPESDAMLRAIPELKERLHLNVELVSLEPQLYRFPAIDPPSRRLRDLPAVIPRDVARAPRLGRFTRCRHRHHLRPPGRSPVPPRAPPALIPPHARLSSSPPLHPPAAAPHPRESRPAPVPAGPR